MLSVSLVYGRSQNESTPSQRLPSPPEKSGPFLFLVSGNPLWQHRAMIELRTFPDNHPDLACSPLLRAALLTLQYAQQHGAIGLTKTMAFKRVFVHWAVEHFDWPGKSAEQMFRYSKVINEYEFPPLEVLHQLLITLRAHSPEDEHLFHAIVGTRSTASWAAIPREDGQLI